MNKHIIVALTAALLAPLPAGSPAGSPVSPHGLRDEVDELLAESVAAASNLAVEEIWGDARALAELVGDEYGPAFDAALDRALRAGGAGGKGTLMLAAARLFGDELDYDVWIEALTPLLDEQRDIALAATELLGSRDVQRGATTEAREKLGEQLVAVAQDPDREPGIRIAAARAAHQVGLAEAVRLAKRSLFDFLTSADPNLRAQGALALGDLGLVDQIVGVEEELERLADLPGEKGRLASAILKQQEIRRHKEREIKRMSDRVRTEIGSQIGASEDLALIDSAIEMVRDTHLEGDVVSREELIEAALDGMLQALDRYSSYFSPTTYKKFEQDLEAEYGGIGAYVGVDPDDNLFTITRPIYSGPAYRAGLYTDDKIVRIGDWPTIGETTDDIIKRLKGKPGTAVKLYVWRDGMDPSLIDRPTEDMSITLERAQITIPPVNSEYLPGDIGYFELITFSRVASVELARRMIDYQKRGMKAVILDLRNNTGGLLSEAVNVSNLFLPGGKTIVSTESRSGRSKPYKTSFDPLVPAEMPVVVMINRFSASASEIVSGALQDHKRAKLVGQRSFGKGSVQNILPIYGQRDDEYADENRNGRHDNWETITKDWDENGEFDFAPRIKLTIERYLLPTGRSIHRELDAEGNIVSSGGVEPDVERRPRRWKQWRLQEMRRVQKTRKVRDWARSTYVGNEDLFAQLAAGDFDDPSAYPGLDGLYEELDTVLPQSDVRYLMRMEVRRIVQDVRGAAFPQGDFQEDVMLQEAIRVVLEEGGKHGVEDIPLFAQTFDEVNEQGELVGDTALPLVAGKEIDEALSLIAEAQDGEGELSGSRLEELNQLLEGLKRNN